MRRSEHVGTESENRANHRGMSAGASGGTCRRGGRVGIRVLPARGSETGPAPRSEWGRLGVRVRPVRAERAAPGAFAVEWFTRRWVNRSVSRPQTFPAYLGAAPGSAIPDRPLPPSPSLGRSSSPRPSRSASPRFAAWHGASPACGWPFASTPSWNARWPRNAGNTIRAAPRCEVWHPAVAGCRAWRHRPGQGHRRLSLDLIGSKPDHGKRPVRAVRSAVARMARQPQPRERKNDRSLVSGFA